MSEFPTLHLLKHVVGVPVVLLAISMQCGCDYIPESPEPRELHLFEHVVGVPVVLLACSVDVTNTIYLSPQNPGSSIFSSMW